MLALLRGWYKMPVFQPGPTASPAFISVIVPFRNEGKNLPALVRDLKDQQMPDDLFEVIWIDDHSEDEGAAILQETSAALPSFKLLQLPAGLHGKKQAIQHGIQAAQGQLIVTTDADCRVGPFWLNIMSRFYEEYKPKLIMGPVTFNDEKGICKKLQTIEFVSLMGSSAGAIGLKRPVMCNAANLAFEKSAYGSLNDPANNQFVSGDDIFLLQNLKVHHRKEILFLKHKDAIVTTPANNSFNNFINQRKRWLSKSSGYDDPDIKLLQFTVYLTCLFTLASFAMVLFATYFLSWALGAVLFKTLIDSLLYLPVARFLGKGPDIPLLLPFQFIYIIYVSLMPVFFLKRNFHWKNRIFRK